MLAFILALVLWTAGLSPVPQTNYMRTGPETPSFGAWVPPVIPTPVPPVVVDPGGNPPPPPPPAGVLTTAHSMPFYWVLSNAPNTSGALPGSVWDIDGENNSSSVVATLHSKGAYVICYISAGTYEPGRSDSSALAPYRGASVQGWPGEFWLDISQPAVLNVMKARMQMCKSKGFDGIEPDNIDSYTNTNANTASEQLAYNKALADAAHALGMTIGLKNDNDQASQLVGNFDWALNEECYDFSECSYLSVFIAVQKPVFIAEYKSVTSHCANAATNKWNLTQFDLDLTGQRTACPSW